MKPFASFVIQIAVTLQLKFSPAQSTPSPSVNNTTGGSAPAITPAISPPVQIHQAGELPGGMGGLLMFQDVWGRSFCRTIEKLVEVVQEYPGEVEHIYSPSCVPLVRCAGCCGDENLECHPTRTSNVTMQLLKIKPAEQGQEYVEMTFVEHQTCECRIRKAVVKSERRRQRGRGKKRKERQRVKDCDRCQPPRR